MGQNKTHQTVSKSMSAAVEALADFLLFPDLCQQR
jgi:hypothetical protein